MSWVKVSLKRKSVFTTSFIIFTLHLSSCGNKAEKDTRKPVDYIKAIPGANDSIPPGILEKGKVLIAYSDCYTCHKVDQRWAGPAFKDIAKRYPVKKPLIQLLARKVIRGGSGSWGSAVMDPHPMLSFEDSKTMITYILSLEK